MQRGDKAPEPSMEEILASIRKIIAEEPIGSRPGPVGEDDDEAPTPRDPFGSLGAGERAGSPSPYARPGTTTGKPVRPDPMPFSSPGERAGEGAARPASPQPQAKAPAPEPKPAEPRRPSWLFSKPTGIPPPPMDPVSPARTVEPLPSAFETTRPGSAPGDGHKFSFPPSPFMKAPAKGEEGAASPFDRPGGAVPEAGDPLHAFDAEERRDEPANDSESGGAGLDGSSADAASEIFAQPSAARAGAVHAPAQVPPSGTGHHATKPAAAGPSFDAGQASQPLPTQEPAAAAEPSAITGHKAPAPAPGGTGAAQSRGNVPEEDASGSAKSAASATRPLAPEAPPKATLSDQAKERTLEDTVADLLRPMLRDWLDSNMPRIVEKALKVELDRIKPGSGKPQAK